MYKIRNDKQGQDIVDIGSDPIEKRLQLEKLKMKIKIKAAMK